MEIDDDRNPKSRWPRRIAIGFGVLLALLALVYFVATSSFFLKSVILPRVGKSMNAEITVADASISPFSSVALRDLRVKTTGGEPLLTAGLVRARYSLKEILGGNIKVDEATVEKLVVHIVKNADGTSNLDPIVNQPPAEQKEPREKPLDLNIRNISLKNAAARITEKTAAGGQNETEISNLNVSLDQLVNNQPSKLTLAADLRMDQKPGAPATNQLLAARLSGSFNFTLNPTNFVPTTLKGAARAEVTQAEGGFADAAGLAAALEADVTPAQVNQLAMRFEKGGQQLGQLRASGPFDTAKLEGLLSLELLSLDRNALNLAVAGKGLDFANSTLNSTNMVEIRRRAQLIGVTGKFIGQKLGVVRDAKPTPPVDLDFEYKITANLESKTASLDKILLNARHRDAEFLNATVDRPLNLSWGSETYGLKDSMFRLTLTNFHLPDWQSLIGTNAPEGTINAGLRLRAQNDGRLLGLESEVLGDRLAVMVGTNLVRDLRLALEAKGNVEDVSRVTLSEYRVTLDGAGARALEAHGALRFNAKNGDFNVQTLLDAALPTLVERFKLPALEPATGLLKYSGNVAKAGVEMQASGTLQLEQFTGKAAGMNFQNHQILSDFNVELRGDDLTIHRGALQMSQGLNRGGSIEVNGRADIAKKSGQVAFKILELNETALGPALAASLAPKKLVSVGLNSAGTATFSPTAGNAIKADLSVTNLVVDDPAGTTPAMPLALRLIVDADQKADLIELRQLELQLTPTERAANRLDIKGKLDLGKTNATPSALTISAESLDVTPYYNIFAGNTNQPAATDTATAQPATDPNAEPAAVDLPLRQLTADLRIGALFLREVAVSNWTATAKINSNAITMRPVSLALNGAPVTADVALDLGVPGYKYDIAFKADRVPVEPLANSFAQTNTYKGELLADAKIRGAGTTGASLRKNLQGDISLTVTNFDFQIVGPKMRRIINPIALILRVPELTQTPISWVDARANIRDGKVNVQKAAVESEAFFADVNGEILLNDVLTNSTLNLPVSLSLRRSLAEKALLLAANTPPDAKYAPLPQFVAVRGTLGAPDTDINKLAIAGLLARAGVGLAGTGVSENVKSAIDLVLPGGGAKTNAPSTNAPGQLLQGLGNILNRNRSTNAPPGAATNKASTNAPATNNPVQNLLNIFKK